MIKNLRGDAARRDLKFEVMKSVGTNIELNQ